MITISVLLAIITGLILVYMIATPFLIKGKQFDIVGLIIIGAVFVISLGSSIIPPKLDNITLENSQLGIQQNEPYLASSEDSGFAGDINKSKYIKSEQFKQSLTKQLSKTQQLELENGNEINVDAKIELDRKPFSKDNLMEVNGHKYHIKDIKLK